MYRYENVSRFYLTLPSTVHGNGTPYSACEVFWFFARATNEPTFCLTTGTVFIFLTMPSADENHDVQIISKRLKLEPSESSKSEQAGKRDAVAPEYYEHFFEKRLSTPQSLSNGRNGKLYQGVCVASTVRSNKLKL